MTELSRQLDSLATVNRDLGFKVMLLELQESATKAVTLDPSSDQGFSVLSSTYGPLTVRAVDVQPLADGSRVVLQIGNLSSADISGGTLKVRYGPRLGENEEWTTWNERLRESEVSFSNTLESGVWNRVSVTLGGVPPAELGFLRIEPAALPSIRLRTR